MNEEIFEYLCKYVSNRRTMSHSQFKNIKYYSPCVTTRFTSSENFHNFLSNKDKWKYDFRKVHTTFTNKSTRKGIIHTYIQSTHMIRCRNTVKADSDSTIQESASIYLVPSSGNKAKCYAIRPVLKQTGTWSFQFW